MQKIEPMQLPPSVLVSYHSPDVRTALHRSVRYKALCTGEVFHIDQSVDGFFGSVYLISPRIGTLTGQNIKW